MDRADITPALARQLIAAQFPKWARLPVRPVDLVGWDNTTFRLGDHLVVRLPSAERYVAQVEKEHRWLPILAPRLGLPIPAPVARGRRTPRRLARERRSRMDHGPGHQQRRRLSTVGAAAGSRRCRWTELTSPRPWLVS